MHEYSLNCFHRNSLNVLGSSLVYVLRTNALSACEPKTTLFPPSSLQSCNLRHCQVLLLRGQLGATKVAEGVLEGVSLSPQDPCPTLWSLVLPWCLTPMGRFSKWQEINFHWKLPPWFMCPNYLGYILAINMKTKHCDTASQVQGILVASNFQSFKLYVKTWNILCQKIQLATCFHY